MSNQTEFEWIEQAKTNGWDAPLRLTLDVLEPFGALGAQVLWVLKPALGAFISPAALQDLATVLEEPDGVQRLRDQLDHDE